MSPRAHDSLTPGTELKGRYRILRRLGQGGAAAVYSARDDVRDHTVALKHVITTDATRGRSRRVELEREYYTLTQLRHPNIVTAYDFGCDESSAFYTMQLLDGDDVRDLAPLPWRRTCEVLADIASALALIHSRRLVHGDVSARNVRCDRQGRAILIDFGAMCTVGAPAPLTGTPPHVAPELGTGQPVDGRVDLYALGALAYWLSSGEHAYPARSLDELATAWRSPPPQLASVAAVPDELAALIMSLIAPDPVARPSSAADVLDRVLAIGGLSPREGPATARAYLANPTLVQRQHELDHLAALVDTAAAGRGSSLVIEGEAGLGASRLLRELVARAKTRGALVLSAAADNRASAFGVARSLARQLLAAADRAATPQLQPLRKAMEQTPAASAASGELPIERHAQLADALRDGFAAVARDQLLVIAVADLGRCDDPSLGVLAALAALATGAASIRLMVAATIGDVGGASPSRLDDLARRSTRISLQPLDCAGGRDLARSVFGTVPHVERLAELTYGLCQGNPLSSLELWRHLVDRGVLRYQDGAWWIPQTLRISDVPSSLDAWYASRVASLDPSARELAELLAIHGASLTLDECVSLVDAPAESVFASIDRLTMARIVRISGVHVSLAQHGLKPALLSGLTERRQQALHGRIGSALLARGFDAARCMLEAGYHLVRGGDPGTGADLIADAARDSAALLASNSAELVRALEAALDHYDAHDREPRRRLVVLLALVRCAFLFDPSLARHAPRALTALRRDSGLALADELAEQNAGESRTATLQRAIMITAARHREAPEGERGFAVDEAIEQLLLVAFSLMGLGVNSLDLPAVERVVALVEPLAELGIAPAAATHRLLRTVVDAMQGRQARAQQGRHAFVEELRAGTLFREAGEGRQRSLLAAQLHGIGLLESIRGGDVALRRADQLDALGLAAFAPAAMQIRVLSHLFNGDEVRANACRAQLDLLALQRTPSWHLDTWILPYLAGPYDLWGDVLGLKNAVAQLQTAAATHPGFEPFLRFARGAYHRERGELAAARSELETALALAPAGRHVAWSPAIAAYVHTLVCAGDYRDAIDHGVHAMAVARRHGLAELWVCGRIEPQLALARAHLGDHSQAAACLDAFISASERCSLPRPMLGKCYEARAQIAILAGDHEAFAAAARRAGICYRATGNATLIAAHDRLWRSAVDAREWRPRPAGPQRDIVTL